MKYKLLKELPFMREGTTFERICEDGIECCVFGVSFHNCVKHYDTMQFSEHENKVLCSIIDNPEWIEAIVPENWTSSDAVEAYDAGYITREQLINFIECY